MRNTSSTPQIDIKRAYEQASPDDGQRALVDRLWPRGLTKVAAHLDLWTKDAAPSPELRRWFNHEPEKFREFGCRYKAELVAKREALEPLLEAARQGKLTLVYAAKDPQCNHALVLQALLQKALAAD